MQRPDHPGRASASFTCRSNDWAQSSTWPGQSRDKRDVSATPLLCFLALACDAAVTRLAPSCPQPASTQRTADRSPAVRTENSGRDAEGLTWLGLCCLSSGRTPFPGPAVLLTHRSARASLTAYQLTNTRSQDGVAMHGCAWPPCLDRVAQ